MPLLNLGKRIAGGAGRGLTRIGSSRGALAAVGVGAFAMGVGSSAAPAAKDLAFEAAFGDPNADRYFTGRDLDARFLAGSMIGGIGGGLLQATSPGDLMATNATAGVIGGTAMGLGGGLAGAAVGGAALGFGVNALKEAATGTKYAALMAGAGGVRAGIAGAAIGGMIGAGSVMGNLLQNNAQFYTQSPYRPSGMVASQLNATGDIVLGMHNSRRGY